MASVVFRCIVCSVVIMYHLVKAELGMLIYAEGNSFLTLLLPKQVAEIMGIDAWLQGFDFNYPCLLS